MPLLGAALLLATSTIFTPPALPVSHETNLCSCVSYVRTLVPEAPRKDAINYEGNSSLKVGSVAIFRYKSGVGHVAVVTAIRDREFLVTESNYKHCTKTSRWLSIDDPSIMGFWG